MTLRPHEIAHQLRADRLARQRQWLWGIVIGVAIFVAWLGLGYFGGALLQWALPR